MFERTRSLGLRILNRLFLRSTIHDTALRVDALHDRMDHLLHCLAANSPDLAARGGISHQIADQGEQLADRLALAVIDLRRGLDRISVEQDRKNALVLKELAALRKALADTAHVLKDITPDKPAQTMDRADTAPALPPAGVPLTDDPATAAPAPDRRHAADPEKRHMAPDRQAGATHPPAHGSAEEPRRT